MLLGIIDPSSGSRRVLGHERPLDAAQEVGYLPEERGLYPAMHAREAIAFMGALRGLPLREGRRRADALLDEHGLGDWAKKPIRTLSKGMAQTVQLLGTIIHKPRLIVLDEPFSGLDAINQEQLEELIRGEARSGATDHLLDPRHRPCRAAVRADRDHRQGQGRVRRQGRRGARPAAPDRPAAHARRATGRGARRSRHARAAKAMIGCSSCPTGGPEPLLKALIDGGAGHRDAGDRAARPARRLRRHRRRSRGGGDGPRRSRNDASFSARPSSSPAAISPRPCCRKTFLFFLLGPLFPLLFGGVFGGIGARSRAQAKQPVVAVVAPASRLRPARCGARRGWPTAIGRGQRSFDAAPASRRSRTSRRSRSGCSRTRDPPVRAVLERRARTARSWSARCAADGTTVGQLRLILADARIGRAQPPELRGHRNVDRSTGLAAGDRAATGQIGQSLLFFLTLLLSTMLLSQLIEEKSNKIIEVMAAAVPIDAMFVGKLFAMLAASLLGLLVWIAAGAAAHRSLVKAGGLATLPPPAVGWPTFLALAVVYFAMNYLLFGAVFLTIGAQASTVREVQTLSMPVTFGQVLIFGFAATRGRHRRIQRTALARPRFPLSSPLAMVARAAEQPAICGRTSPRSLWQALWVALILRARRAAVPQEVLKSGPRTRWWRRSGKALRYRDALGQAARAAPVSQSCIAM